MTKCEAIYKGYYHLEKILKKQTATKSNEGCFFAWWRDSYVAFSLGGEIVMRFGAKISAVNQDFVIQLKRILLLQLVINNYQTDCRYFHTPPF